jgi:hypothetical protein
VGAEETGADSTPRSCTKKEPLKTNPTAFLSLNSNASERWRGASLADGEAVAERPGPHL